MALSAQPESGWLDLTASAGASRAATYSITSASGLPVTGWSGGDVLTVEVWPGDDRAALTGSGLTVAWSDAPNGVVRITSTGAHTLTPASYHWRAMATSGGSTYEIVRGKYEIYPSPGTVPNTVDPATKPYTTLDDLRTLMPNVEELLTKFDRSGFAEHQEAARQWLDDIVLASWKSNRGQRLTPSWSRYPYWTTAVDEPPQWLVEVLETGEGIKITPRIKRALAAYACYSICNAQMVIDEKASSYAVKAVRFRKMASAEITSQVIWVKEYVNATDYTWPINLASIGAN